MTTADAADPDRLPSWQPSTNTCRTSETCCTQLSTTVSTPPTCSTSSSASSRCTPPRRKSVCSCTSTPLSDQIDALCREHDDLHRWLADGLTGPRVPDALRLLVTHIDDEEYDLFPHIFHALDPEQWDDIELAHRAVEAVWDAPTEHQETS